MAMEIEVIINPSDRPMPEDFDPAGSAWSCVIRRNGATEVRAPFYTGSRFGTPTALDVLGALKWSADSIYQGWNDDEPTTFEAWADELGYDPDSRKAERIYDGCKSEANRMREFFGNPAAFNVFLYSTPDDPEDGAWEELTDCRVLFHYGND